MECAARCLFASFFLWSALVWFGAQSVCADEFAPQQLELFEKQIRPLLVEHCLKCHGLEKREGGFNLATRESLVKGGDSGAALVAGKPEESLLVKAVEYLGEPKMPPSGKLSAEKIELVRRWVESGAAWPKDSPLSAGATTARSFQITEKQRQWWAFQPRRDTTPPDVRATEWPRNDLDPFVLAKLEAAGLAPAPETDRVAWLRRATFDLTGLPPTPQEVEAFLSDTTDRAFETVVDRLLNSPAYGQRWARHWLDVVRYADYHDSNPAARTASCEITEAWRYRDWVVDAFNRDLPLDQFIVHQIAGDQLPSPTGEEIYSDGLIATTFLSNGVWDRGDADKEKIVSDMVDDNIGVIGRAFLGLTLDCARCHDHKFDPISTEDYYGLAGMFYSSHILKELGAKGGEYNVNRVPLIGPTALAKRVEQEKRLGEVTATLAELDRQHRLLELIAGGRTLIPATFQSEAGAMGMIADDGSIAVSGKLAKDKYVVETVMPDGLKARYVRLQALPEAALPASGPGRASDGNYVVSRFSASFVPPDRQAEPTAVKFVSAQADFEQTNFAVQSALDNDLKDGWAVSPQFGKAHVAVFDVAPETVIPAGSRLRVTIEHQYANQHSLGKFRLSVAETLTTAPPAETTQRQELISTRDRLQKELADPVPLAMAVTDGGTPGGLFPGIQDVPIHIRGSYARLGPVVPRRLPQFFAGENQPPITQGSGRRELAAWIASPSNPLTARVIVNRVWHWHFGEGLARTPSNFGMLSEPPTHPELLDWLATRFIEDGWSLKKLHRRIMLSATYRQSSRVSREVFDKDPENRLLGRFTPRRLEAEAIRDAILSVSGQLDLTAGGPAGDDFIIRRRSLYVQTARWQRDSYANLFDAANPDASTERRVTSTVAPQALLLLNHPWMLDQARHLAERLVKDVPEGDAARIERAYQLLYGRKPSDEELTIAQTIIAGDDPALPNCGWVDLAHVLLCSNEMIYTD
ncbi:MAG: PSD1 and planctomycete cytochrome C domain-containing protein [Planctomycetota bacterium]|jgi:mono/diheme cytochrome c family protein|nr:PSD1 and planctomycete cytochrome C domain-containing protein [Planctomycetota bacterium]